jgi:hypothetical protein
MRSYFGGLATCKYHVSAFMLLQKRSDFENIGIYHAILNYECRGTNLVQVNV